MTTERRTYADVRLYCMVCREELGEDRIRQSSNTCGKRCGQALDNVRRKVRNGRGRPISREELVEFRAWKKEMNRELKKKRKEDGNAEDERVAT